MHAKDIDENLFDLGGNCWARVRETRAARPLAHRVAGGRTR